MLSMSPSVSLTHLLVSMRRSVLTNVMEATASRRIRAAETPRTTVRSADCSPLKKNVGRKVTLDVRLDNSNLGHRELHRRQRSQNKWAH
jgi:hypothetical protein